MTKTYISTFLRRLRLLHLADYSGYLIQKAANYKNNLDFKFKNPDIKLPADYLLYESFQLNYFKYYFESIESARWLTDLLKKHTILQNKKILDWGCGPGRLIRHLPAIIGNDCEFFGSDSNKRSIDWCKKNIEGCSFVNNQPVAELPFQEDFFDIIIGISVFTHLSEQMHYKWFNELFRILKPNGIMLFTTQGDNYKAKLTKAELRKFNRGVIIVRGNVKSGHRIFSAFQPDKFMLGMFKNVQVLEHISLNPEKGKQLPQDVWIVRKVDKFTELN